MRAQLMDILEIRIVFSNAFVLRVMEGADGLSVIAKTVSNEFQKP